MVNINIYDGWKIRSDVSNWILEREQSGRVQEQYFYSSMEKALSRFIDKKIMRSEATDIQSLITYVKLVQTRLNTALLPLKLVIVSQEVLVK